MSCDTRFKVHSLFFSSKTLPKTKFPHLKFHCLLLYQNQCNRKLKTPKQKRFRSTETAAPSTARPFISLSLSPSTPCLPSRLSGSATHCHYLIPFCLCDPPSTVSPAALSASWVPEGAGRLLQKTKGRWYEVFSSLNMVVIWICLYHMLMRRASTWYISLFSLGSLY